MTYAGIGSRETPPKIQKQMKALASKLAVAGYTLRSGGAKGADLAFESGVQEDNMKEIFYKEDATDETKDIAKEIHPKGNKLTEALGLSYHARNTNQIFGANLDAPVDFVIAWTPEGKLAGGTAQAIKMASKKGIPVVNMFEADWAEQLDKILTKTTVSDLGITHISKVSKKKTDKLYSVVSTVVKNTEGKTKAGHKAVWFGNHEYIYTGATHSAKTMPPEIVSIKHLVEEALGLEKDYYNAVLINEYPPGVGIKEHSDAEKILKLDDGTVGSVGVLSLGGQSVIDIIKNKKIIESHTIMNGDIYELPAGKFQLNYKHAVGKSTENRISLTFRKTRPVEFTAKEIIAIERQLRKTREELYYYEEKEFYEQHLTKEERIERDKLINSYLHGIYSLETGIPLQVLYGKFGVKIEAVNGEKLTWIDGIPYTDEKIPDA